MAQLDTRVPECVNGNSSARQPGTNVSAPPTRRPVQALLATAHTSTERGQQSATPTAAPSMTDETTTQAWQEECDNAAVNRRPHKILQRISAPTSAGTA
jgi:hypothetical protein